MEPTATVVAGREAAAFGGGRTGEGGKGSIGDGIPHKTRGAEVPGRPAASNTAASDRAAMAAEGDAVGL